MGKGPTSTSLLTLYITASGHSKAFAVTTHLNGPAIFRLDEHVERLFQTAHIFLIDIPYTAKRSVMHHQDRKVTS